MLVKLIMCGIFSAFPALLVEMVGDWVLQSFLSENSLVYHLITCMIIVAYAENIPHIISVTNILGDSFSTLSF